MNYEFCTRTDPGLARENNEDSVTVDEPTRLGILADGMGGYNAGEVASGMAVEVIKQYLDTAFTRILRRRLNLPIGRERRIVQLLTEAIQRANDAILEAARADSDLSGMGTTLVAAAFRGRQLRPGPGADRRRRAGGPGIGPHGAACRQRFAGGRADFRAARL